MGTNSVGWAVTDEHYNLMRAKGKDLWGIREFESATGAAERRAHRVSRRNRQRQQVRIGMLQDYFHDAICEVDPYFYQRLDNSKYYLEDKDEEVRYKYGIFNDPDYTDKDYYAQYPTIFHLRQELIHNPEPHDVRLVYLALLNMFKHRGHFLNASLTSEDTVKIGDAYMRLQATASEILGLEFPDVDASKIESILSSREINRTHKAEKLNDLFGFTKKNNAKEVLMVRAICGLKIDAAKLFAEAGLKESVTVCFSDANYEDNAPDISAAIGDTNFDLLQSMKEIADIGALAGVLKGYTYLSEARVGEYDKHKEDLKLLKSLFRKYLSIEDYDKMFRSGDNGTYGAYVNSFNSGSKQRRNMKGRTREDLYKSLNKYLKSMPDEDESVQYVKDEISKETFLPKQLTASNGIIPNQVHLKEMKKILKNAEGYLPFLKVVDESGLTTSERIVKLFSFRIPYYVGPVTGNSAKDGGNGWVVRKAEGEVLPWNINEKIDIHQTQEQFIKRLVRNCTYISGEKVLPKGSLLYEKFAVLNEINNLKIDNEKISVSLKQDIYNDLFLTGKRVTKKKLLKYLNSQGYLNNEAQLTGVDQSINNSLSSYGKFLGVFGDNLKKDSVFAMAEDIIYWCTVFGDSKKTLKKILKEKYPEQLTDDQIKRIAGFKFNDWGRMSKQFLELQGMDKETGEVLSLIQAMWQTNFNMMELLHSERFTFGEELQKKEVKVQKSLTEFKHDDLDEFYFSAPVKRMIWQTLLIIKELEKVLGAPPTRLFVEMTRSDDIKGDKGRKKSRKDELLELYKNVKDESRDWNELINSADEKGTLRSKKMFLYLTQRGRDMYTGEPIDLDQLFNDNLYDIDHIYPRHFVKDDNLRNNLALVDKRRNARKSDTYPIESDIRSKCSALWYSLKKDKLITEEKYRRLTGTNPFTDEQKAGFIARQMVETSQATKGVNDLLKQLLPDTELVYSKAGNVSEFRNKYDLLKSRSINDFHHANDAYLNIVVGNTYFVKFTKNPLNYIKKYNQDKSKYAYNLSRIFDRDVKRGDEVAWVADDKQGNHGTIVTVKKVIAKHTPLLTRMAFEYHGQISDATLSSKLNAKPDVYISLKGKDSKMQDVEKYGGFNKVKGAYFFLVEHEVKGKRIRTIETVPVYLKDKLKTKEALEDYCVNSLGLINPSVRLKRILIQSVLKINGYELSLNGRSGSRLVVGNMVSLCLSQNWNNYIHYLDKYTESGYINRNITKEKNDQLYDQLTQKHSKTILEKRPNSMGTKLADGRADFESLNIKQQCDVLLQIIGLTQIGATEVDLKLIGGSSRSGSMFIGKRVSSMESVLLVCPSVTGVYKTTIDLLKI